MNVSVIVPVVDGDSPPWQVLREFDERIIVHGNDGQAKSCVNDTIMMESARGRAVQMNAGAAIATGEVLLFLHADTLLPGGAANRIRAAVLRGAPGGCFETAFAAA